MNNFTEALKYFPNIPDGITLAKLDGVNYFKRTSYKESEPNVYRSGICFILSGHKKVSFDTKTFQYDANNYLVVSMDLPLRCEVCANITDPVRGIFISIEPSEIRELIDMMNLSDKMRSLNSKNIPTPIGPSQMDDEMRDVVIRFLKALQSETETKILGNALKKEILYRALCGSQAEMLFKIAAVNGPLSQISNVINLMQRNYNKDIDVDSLAKNANLSVSSFYRLFKEVTSDTPIQYLKKIRLNKARDMIIAKNVKAYVAAVEVGYESVSQFSREFKRYFGMTPATLKAS